MKRFAKQWEEPIPALEHSPKQDSMYRDMFYGSAVSAWHLDTKGLIPIFERLQAEGASDLFIYAKDHPGFVREAQEAMRVIDVNDATLNLFGASNRNQIVGGSAAPFWIEGRCETFLECINVTFSGATSFRGETWLKTLDGREIFVLFTKSEPDSLHQAGEALLSIVDLTDRLKAQRALEEAQANFAHSARVSLLGELTASIAHEVNQPLATITTYGRAGSRWLRQDEPDINELRNVMANMIEPADRASKIIDRIRSMVMPAANTHLSVSLNELIVEALQFVAPELRKLQCEYTLQLFPELPTVHGDPIQLQQIVINLALNAAQAMEHSVTRLIKIRTSCEEDQNIQLEVEDTGPGIDEAYTDRLFESFFTTKISGMGIGLGVCRSIVEAHDGTISVVNKKSGGVVATILLPIR